MPADLCGVVLAAGAGIRLRPVTMHRPKPLCPVANRPLVDHALDRVHTATGAVAVNLHHGREALASHLLDREDELPVQLSIEEPEALGTAGALGLLRPWIDGRGTVVLNGDTWCPGSLAEAARTWDRQRVRVLVTGRHPGFTGRSPGDVVGAIAGPGVLDPTSRLAGAFMPWAEVARLEPTPSGLYEASWGRLAEQGQLDVVQWDGPCVDCGTPADYLRANLLATGGASSIGPTARVRGTVERSVIWDGAEVHPSEHLVDAIRTDTNLTVLIR